MVTTRERGPSMLAPGYGFGIRLDHTPVKEGQWVIQQYRNAGFRQSITCGPPALGTAAGCIAAR